MLEKALQYQASLTSENGEMCIVWLGAEVNPKFLEDLYGVESLDALDPRMVSSRVLSSFGVR